GQMLNRIENGEKALILIEEIDTFEVSRNDENKPIPTADNPTLTTHKVFGDFLNSLDGITAKEGIIMFATTNHREKL
ncbi:AAA family ATPase, partial [Streptomyces galilaeus]|uniref:AAA family ATPase n=1 Tax=Streptomyces galilaeus TaxID=33899 RepID=UPI0038F64AF9